MPAMIATFCHPTRRSPRDGRIWGGTAKSRIRLMDYQNHETGQYTGWREPPRMFDREAEVPSTHDDPRVKPEPDSSRMVVLALGLLTEPISGPSNARIHRLQCAAMDLQCELGMYLEPADSSRTSPCKQDLESRMRSTCTTSVYRRFMKCLMTARGIPRSDELCRKK